MITIAVGDRFWSCAGDRFGADDQWMDGYMRSVDQKPRTYNVGFDQSAAGPHPRRYYLDAGPATGAPVEAPPAGPALADPPDPNLQ